jgi:hypothetical protein
MIYKFRDGAHLTGDAQKVGERLAALEASGRLTAKAVVQEARSDDSPLHPLFEWDDAKAADKYRIAHAGHVIRCVTVVLDQQQSEEPKTIRAFVPITQGDESRQYVDTVRALSDTEMRRQVLAQAHAELGAVARKYRELKELADVVNAIDRVGELLKEGQHS